MVILSLYWGWRTLKDLSGKYFHVCLIFIFLLIFYQQPLQAEIYPTQVKLTIRSRGELVGQDEFFEILEMDDYILIPLVSLSRWLEIDLNYDRENQLLSVYYEERDISILIDLRHQVYYDFPEWSADPPVIVEADFYVAEAMIEYLTGAKVDWQPRRQELILDYDYTEEKEGEEAAEVKIKKRPEDIKIEPDVTGPDFYLGAIQYKIGFDYEFDDDDSDDSEEEIRQLNNLLYLYGRAGDWALTTGQLLEYNFESEEYNYEDKLLSARNIENDRVIVFGDNKFRFSNTLGSTDLRGAYFQYPIQQISERRAYTSISGEAEEGSTVTLYANERKVGEKYIYQGEDKYFFENVPLTEERTNIFRILIQDIDGKETEIVKKVAGSLNMYEAGTNEGIIAAGSNNKNDDSESIFEIGGFHFKYAPSNNTSLFWELGVERIFEDSEYEGVNLGSKLRVAVRPEDLPLVFLTEWLAGREVDLIDHGVRATTLYTREEGYIKASFDYIPPVIEETVDVDAGQLALLNYEKELNENWLVDIGVENYRSILEMDEFDINTFNVAFDYSDKARNTLNIGTELGTKEEDVEWRKLDLTEKSRDWFDITLKGRTFRGKTRFGSEVTYIMSDISFYDDSSLEQSSKREDYAYIRLNFNSSLTDSLLLSSNLRSSFTWLEGSRDESETDVDLRARLKTGKYTSITAGISREVEFERDINGDDDTEEVDEIELFLRHSVPRDITLTTGVKKTFLDAESYYSANAGIEYENQKNDWRLSLDYEYITPYESRDSSQKIIDIELSKNLISGLEGFLNFKRSYASSKSEDPVYEASIYFSQSLGFTPDRIKGQKYPKYQRETYNSYIAGLVYLDENGSGEWDEGEQLLSDIGIFSDGRRLKTDEDGYFIIENVRRGLYNIGFNLSELPDQYTAVTEDKIVQMRDNENIFLEFALTKLGQIKGQVTLADAGFAENEAEEIPLSWVKLEIEELNRTTFSRSDGTFSAVGIPLGQYTLRVVEESLPAGTAVQGEGVYKVNITTDNLINQEIEVTLVPEN